MTHQMTVNPTTGFLEAPAYHGAFTSERKELFISYLEKQPFKIREACDFVGIDTGNFYRHQQMDVEFARRLQLIKDRRVEEIEQKLADMALKDDQVADRIFFLKAHKPGLYNPGVKINVTVDEKDVAPLEFKAGQVVDAVIVAGDSTVVECPPTVKPQESKQVQG